jgi:hypothetical protein
MHGLRKHRYPDLEIEEISPVYLYAFTVTSLPAITLTGKKCETLTGAKPVLLQLRLTPGAATLPPVSMYFFLIFKYMNILSDRYRYCK